MHDPRVLLDPATDAVRKLARRGYQLDLAELDKLSGQRRASVRQVDDDPDFHHLPDAFDGDRSRLFCYSPEMLTRYADHRPAQALSVQFGLGEETPPPAVRGSELVWLGRIDSQKAPHLAVRAAKHLGRAIRLIGPIFDQDYAVRYAADLNAPHVTLSGEPSAPAAPDVR
ncbi:MAG TPA: hypothetical protein VF444_21570 [Pseudonocardiaceae bacterium]